MKQTLKITIYILGIFFVGFLAYLLGLNKQNKKEEPVYCTQDVKLCVDGSYVGRVPPKCEFKPCQVEEEGDSKTVTDDRATFKHPTSLGTEFISAVAWPPQLDVVEEEFNCVESETTTKRMIGGRTYCITKKVEGAAGSFYTEYSYSFEKNNKKVAFTFTLREVECANYDGHKQFACENEKSLFDLDKLVDEMATSVEL